MFDGARIGGSDPRSMKKHRCTLSLFAALLVGLASASASAEDLIVEDELDPDAAITDVTLIWDENSEPDIAGYNVYYGRTSGTYVGFVTVRSTKAVIGVKGTRTVYFAVTAFNTNGDESEFSAEVRWP
jgi:hypothetical protein